MRVNLLPLLCSTILIVSFSSCTDHKKPSKKENVDEKLVSENLNELSWLVGSWEDDGDDESMSSTFKWDKDINFLIQSFTLKQEGKEELKGKQVIGWDPIRKQIRSWVFNSEGGFGEGYWTKDDDDTWFSKMKFNLPDGSVASATHAYTKIDKDHYTFSSFSRDLDGEILPNIGPFQETRKK